MKEALSSAEEARLARDSAVARASDLERQAELANTRLATVRQVRGGALHKPLALQITQTMPRKSCLQKARAV